MERRAGLLRHAHREGPATIGFGRDLNALTGAPVGARDFVWETAPDGAAVAALVLASPGAAGIRVQLLAKSVPEDLKAGFYDPRDAEGTVEWISADELTSTSSTTDDGYLYWSPTVGGDRIGIELRIPSGASRGASVAIPRISHLDQTVDAAQRSSEALCDQIDAVCRSDRISDPARNSVAKYLYTTESGETASCTGNLLNDQDLATQIPYFLTANHCAETVAEVASTEFYWFHETPVCGDDSAYSTLRQGRGATRLAHDGFYGSDMALMRLHEKPPSGVGLAGWTTETVVVGDDVVGVHHPDRQVKKILIGTVVRFNYPASSTHKAMMRASEGTSIGGSSGAGIWRRDDSGRDYLVGTISESTGGTCPPRERVIFARLSVFQPRIAEWLGVGSAPEEIYVGGHVGFLLREPLGPVIATLGDGDVLDLGGNRVVDLWPLTAMAGIEVLDLRDNAVADLSPLAGLPHLRVLDLSGNQVADISPLAGLTSLRRLDLSGNRVTDLRPLSELRRLEVLLLDGNRVADLAPLWGLPELAHLGLGDNRVADAALLQGTRSLRRLDLRATGCGTSRCSATSRSSRGCVWQVVRSRTSPRSAG